MTLTYLRNGETLTLDPALCTGCGTCVEVCPHEVFRIEKGAATIAHRSRCMECGACAGNCPEGALRVRAGVGCAAAVLNGLVHRTEPSCGCSSAQKKGGSGSERGCPCSAG
jgi:NAD-dependent dihydropyrimidine dehydrogenase PreA subunit